MAKLAPSSSETMYAPIGHSTLLSWSQRITSFHNASRLSFSCSGSQLRFSCLAPFDNCQCMQTCWLLALSDHAGRHLRPILYLGALTIPDIIEAVILSEAKNLNDSTHTRPFASLRATTFTVLLECLSLAAWAHENPFRLTTGIIIWVLPVQGRWRCLA